MKNQSSSQNIIVAIDIGTTKICVLVAQKIRDNQIDILGIGKAPSSGMARGVIVNIAQAIASMRQAIKEAELMSGYKIQNVYAGISGAHIQALSSEAMVPIKNQSVKQSDINSILAAAQAIVIPEGQQILHILPQIYKIDGQFVHNPLGMFGLRLEAKVHIITGSVAAVQNIVKCCQLAGVTVKDVILEPLASSDAVLSDDEKELGVGILDIGGGTSDFAVFSRGAINYTKIFDIAGNHVTQDIALCLRTSIKDAERIKREFARARLEGTVDLEKRFEVEMVQGDAVKSIALHNLIEIVSCRVCELFYLVRTEINKNGLEHIMPAGIVITGGGSLLEDLAQTAEKIIELPVRIGSPKVPDHYSQSLSSPIYATSYGLLLQIFKKEQSASLDEMSGSLVNKILLKMKSWVVDFF